MSDGDLISIDTNVILRHLLSDDEDHSPRAFALFLRVRPGLQHIYCPDAAQIPLTSAG